MVVESLTPISEANLLEEVKASGVSKGNDYNDDTILFWIEQVKGDLAYAGVSVDVLGSTLAVGCIARGVDEYWVERREEYSSRFWGMAQRLKDIKVKGAE